MTLTAFRIANFKAFAAGQRVPLRPITLIYGANSAGKSSILHALALAHHAIETGELDTQRTQIGGESIDLGGFRQFVYRRERERQVELGFEVDVGSLSGRVADLLRSARHAVVDLAIGAGTAGALADRAGGVRVERFSFEVDGAPLLSMSARPGGLLRLDRLEHAHPVFRELFRALLIFSTTTKEVREDDFAALSEVLDSLVPRIIGETKGLFPRLDEEAETSEALRQGAAGLLPVSRGRRHEDLASAARLFLPKALRELVGGIGTALETEIRRLRYLGPLRSYPPRHLALSQDQDSNWFAGGGHAWDVVRTREEVRRRVNGWLGDVSRLKTPYELEVHELLSSPAVAADLPAKLNKALGNLAVWLLGRSQSEPTEMARLAERVAEKLAALESDDLDQAFPEIEELVSSATDTETLSERWTAEMTASRPESLQDLVLIDKRTGTSVSHRDVGIGISQVLPVLVSAFASKDKLLAIEQPEIHLHPALQAELGDVFLASALGSGNTFLVETHSEHLLLRIMRRMRETNAGELPTGAQAVRPNDVMLLFVEPDGPQSIIREMPLNERGELVKAWPGGFFEEGLREIF